MRERLKIQVFTEIDFSDFERAIDDGRKYVKLKSRDEPYEVDEDTYKNVLKLIEDMNVRHDKLKPCPWCGSKSARLGYDKIFDEWFRYCPNCCARGPVFHQCHRSDATSKAEAEAETIAAWNRRA